MDIKEIALKVADSLRNKVDGISHMQSNQGLVRFAEALVAEIQRRGEPVYQVCKSDSVSLSSAWIDVDSQTYDDAGLYPEYGRRILYTFLPSIEALEDKVAEACARVYLDTYDLTDIAESIRSGARKEFKKS